MSIPRHLRKKSLDGKMLFYHYHEQMGKASSLNKLQEWLYNQGIFNEQTGKPFTTAALYSSMWRWALQNLDEALPVYKRFLLEYNVYEKDEDLMRLMRERASRYLNKVQQKRFFEQYGSE